MKELFDNVSYKTSKAITAQYSTSFSLGIHFLHRDLHRPVHSIYGFVRLADEIVDTFHAFDKGALLSDFEKETFDAIERGISLNPVLNSFQWVVNRYAIDHDLIRCFLHSMRMDLSPRDYTDSAYREYILGSAEAVGLMCLQVFAEGRSELYRSLKPSAMALGAAFQKVNFLRDLAADYHALGRVYFPDIDISDLNENVKSGIEADISADFEKALAGIRRLPKKARLGVYVAYIYYRSLFNKIRKTNARRILDARIRIPNTRKVLLFAGSYVRHSLNLL